MPFVEIIQGSKRLTSLWIMWTNLKRLNCTNYELSYLPRPTSATLCVQPTNYRSFSKCTNYKSWYYYASQFLIRTRLSLSLYHRHHSCEQRLHSDWLLAEEEEGQPAAIDEKDLGLNSTSSACHQTDGCEWTADCHRIREKKNGGSSSSLTEANIGRRRGLWRCCATIGGGDSGRHRPEQAGGGVAAWGDCEREERRFQRWVRVRLINRDWWLIW
jgi:hypothetical protein